MPAEQQRRHKTIRRNDSCDDNPCTALLAQHRRLRNGAGNGFSVPSGGTEPGCGTRGGSGDDRAPRPWHPAAPERRFPASPAVRSRRRARGEALAGRLPCRRRDNRLRPTGILPRPCVDRRRKSDVFLDILARQHVIDARHALLGASKGVTRLDTLGDEVLVARHQVAVDLSLSSIISAVSTLPSNRCSTIRISFIVLSIRCNRQSMSVTNATRTLGRLTSSVSRQVSCGSTYVERPGVSSPKTLDEPLL